MSGQKVTLEVERAFGGNRLLQKGRPVAIHPRLKDAVDELRHGTTVTAQCEMVDGELTVTSLGGKSKKPVPPLHERVRALMMRGESTKALAELRGAAPGVVAADPRLLGVRIQLQGNAPAGSELGIELASDISRLLETILAPETRTAALAEVDRQLTTDRFGAGGRFHRALSGWLQTHGEQLLPQERERMLRHLPLAHVPFPLLLVSIAEDSTELTLPGMLAAAVAAEPGNLLIPDAEARARRRMQAERDAVSVAAEERFQNEFLALREVLQGVAQRFDATLPRPFLDAWGASEDGPNLRRFLQIGVQHVTIRQLAESARTSRAACFPDEERALPFLPFANGERLGETLGLWLAQPRPGGDFAVLSVLGTQVTVVANSTADWLRETESRAAGSGRA